jgi:hypothetical protein
MPDGLMLAGTPRPAAEEVQALPHAQRAAFRGGVALQLTGTPAAFTGYWLPEWRKAVREHELAFNRQAVPLHYQQGETFNAAELSGIPRGVRPALHWHYLGLPVAVPTQPPHPKVLQGIARPRRQPLPASCNVRARRVPIWQEKAFAASAHSFT